MASVVVATAFHELGHASACRYGGARPGVMGVGVYLVWPAFYCDVTDAYRLNRAGRLRTDLGGVYFNGIFALLAGAVYFVTGQEALLFAAFVQHTIALQQLLPLLRFDGYYVLSDLTGVPDILSRIKPILRSLVPGGGREPRVDELKPWVRFVVTAYLLVLIPTLLLLAAWFVIAAPRLIATVHDALSLQIGRIGDAPGAPRPCSGRCRPPPSPAARRDLPQPGPERADGGARARPVVARESPARCPRRGHDCRGPRRGGVCLVARRRLRADPAG